MYPIMAYQADLTFHTYSKPPYGPCLAVGWLEKEHPFTQGGVPIEVLRQLGQWLLDEQMVFLTRGIHQTTILPGPAEIVQAYQEHQLPDEPAIWNGEIHIAYRGRYYVAPTAIYEYITKYGYQPPAIFCEAVLDGKLVTPEEELRLIELTDENPAYWEEEDPNLNRLFTQAQELIQKGATYKAQKVLDQLFAIDPDWTKGLFLLARIHQEDKQYAAAREVLNRMEQLSPNSHMIYALRAFVHFENRDYEAAQADLQLVLPTLAQLKNRNLAQAYFLQGRLAMEQHDFESAAKYFQQVLEITPHDSGTRRLLQRVKLRKTLGPIFRFGKKS